MRNFTRIGLLIVASFVFIQTLRAQIIYTNSNYASIADSIHISQASSGLSTFNFAATGANYTWNFSTLPVTSQDNDVYTNPVSDGYKLTWCAFNGYVANCTSQFNLLTNLALGNGASVAIGGFSLSNVVNHYKKSTGSLSLSMVGYTINLGSFPAPLAVPYSAPDTIYRFPLTYGNVDSNRNKYTINLNSLGVNLIFTASAQRKNNVNGWGSLVTPYRTFLHVLKLKTIIVSKDTLFSGSNTTPTLDSSYSYQWFDSSFKEPVLEAHGQIVNGNEVISGISYIDSARCIAPVALFSYSPIVNYFDSANSIATVNFNNLSSNSDSSRWFFGDGTSASASSPTHTYSCPGVKSVMLIAYNKHCSPIIGDTLILPLLITDTTQYSIATATITGANTICTGLNVQLHANTGAGLSYQWLKNGSSITGATNAQYNANQTGNYRVSEINNNGCKDSSATINITVTPAITHATTATICQGQSYSIGSFIHTSSGIYIDTLFTSAGCDSIVTLNLTVKPTYSNATAASICNGAAYSFAGTNYTATGIYQHHFTTVYGCDSLVTLTLTVNPIYANTITASVCNGSSYSFAGSTYTSAGNYIHHFSSVSGCDSAVTLSLTVTTGYSSTIFANICNGSSYSFGGSVYTVAGIYSHHFTSTGGCDSLVTLTLSVNPTYSLVQTTSICGNNTYSFGGNTYTTSGIYQHHFNTALGCDSLVILHLTVQPIPAKPTVVSPVHYCLGSVADTLIAAGQNLKWYSDTMLAASNSSPIPPTVVSGNKTWFVSQVINGCEGYKAGINVQVNALPAPSISVSGNVLSTGSFHHYQWLRNGTILISDTLHNITVNQSGNYSVTVTDTNGCTGISTAYSYVSAGIGNQAMNIVNIYPNPASRTVIIDAPEVVSVEISDMEGKVILRELNTHLLDVHVLSSGNYIVRIFDKSEYLIDIQRLSIVNQ